MQYLNPDQILEMRTQLIQIFTSEGELEGTQRSKIAVLYGALSRIQERFDSYCIKEEPKIPASDLIQQSAALFRSQFKLEENFPLEDASFILS